MDIKRAFDLLDLPIDSKNWMEIYLTGGQVIKGIVEFIPGDSNLIKIHGTYSNSVVETQHVIAVAKTK